MEGGGWLLLILDVVGAALLAGALIYGMAMWRKRPKSPAATADAKRRFVRTIDVAGRRKQSRRTRTLRPGN